MFACSRNPIACAAMPAARNAIIRLVTALGTVLWDSSGILSDSSLLCKVLHTLIGYNDRPTGMQMVIYLAILAVTYILMKFAAPVPIPAHLRR